MNSYETAVSISEDFFKLGAIEVQGENGVFYNAFLYDIIENNTNDCQPAPNSQNYSNKSGSDIMMTSGAMNSSNSLSSIQSNTYSTEPQVIVTFQNNQLGKTSFPISRIRLPPGPLNANDNTVDSLQGLSSLNISNASNDAAANSNTSQNPTTDEPIITVGMEVEVLSSNSEDQPRGWWRATVKMIKG